jgi:hypothetical protein
MQALDGKIRGGWDKGHVSQALDLEGIGQVRSANKEQRPLPKSGIPSEQASHRSTAFSAKRRFLRNPPPASPAQRKLQELQRRVPPPPQPKRYPAPLSLL